MEKFKTVKVKMNSKNKIGTMKILNFENHCDVWDMETSMKDYTMVEVTTVGKSIFVKHTSCVFLCPAGETQHKKDDPIEITDSFII